MTRLDRGAVIAAVIAASLGAATSAYRALGGTASLDAVGDEIERWSRERSAGVVATLSLITVVGEGAARSGAVCLKEQVDLVGGRLLAGQ